MPVLPLPLALSLAGLLLVSVARLARWRHAAAGPVADPRLGIAAAAPGQPLDSLSPSTRVRVNLHEEARTPERAQLPLFGRGRTQPVVGTIAAWRTDTALLVVAPGAEPLRVPRSAIHAVYASRGRTSRWQSALRSAVVPALAGAAVRALGTSVRRGEGDPTPVRTALSGAAMGAAFAAAKGALFPKERWQRVSLPTSVAADAVGR